jgi:hypothetical protein
MLRRLTGLVACSVIVVGACGSDDATAVPSTPTEAPTELVETTTLTSEEPPLTTNAPATTLPASTATTTSPTTAPQASTTTLPPFPPAIDSLGEGGTDVWVVVLAGSTEFNAPVLLDAIDAAAAAGYYTGLTDCDVGASTALGMADSGVFTVSVYLSSEADARAAAEAFASRGVLGVVAQVQVFCLD